MKRQTPNVNEKTNSKCSIKFKVCKKLLLQLLEEGNNNEKKD